MVPVVTVGLLMLFRIPLVQSKDYHRYKRISAHAGMIFAMHSFPLTVSLVEGCFERKEVLLDLGSDGRGGGKSGVDREENESLGKHDLPCLAK
jgi:hypothetical protein